MATLNFIRGTVRGKIGQFVGSSWKGKGYIKTFTKPGNPKTADQVAVRTVFQNVSHVAKSIYENVLKKYTFPKPKMQTAYNRMIQINKPMFEGKQWNPALLKIFDGPLNNAEITAASVQTDHVVVTWSSNTGHPMDKAIAVIFDGASGAVSYLETVRTAGSAAVSIADIDSSARDDLHAYLVFVREPVQGTAEKGQVSGTAYKKVS